MKKIKLLFIFSLLIVGEIKAQKDPCARSIHTVYRMNYGNGIDLQFGLNNQKIKGLAIIVGMKFLADTATSDIIREKSGYKFATPTLGIAYIRSFKDFIQPMAFSLHLNYVMGSKEYNFFETTVGVGYVLSNYVIFNLNTTFRLKNTVALGAGFIVFI